jgi:DNA repair exonuclease SbcCD ATPase subunit
MKLTHVAVEGCGRFAKPARIEGLGPGVNILSASNEAGKSTLFRAIRTCLFERHSSTKEEIAALATEGLSLPVIITVGFENGGKAYEIRKSFLRSKSASLSCDGVETARNAEADEEVWKLLGIEPRSTRALDEAAYGILWVAQGHSFNTPEPSEGAKSALNTVIQQEVGTLVGGERARLLLNSVSEELARYVTKTGQPKSGGPLHDAISAREKLTQDRLDAETLLDDLRKRLDLLDEQRKAYAAASNPSSLAALKEQLDAARTSLTDAETAAEAIRRLEGEEMQARQWAAAQQEKVSQLNRQAGEIGAARQRLKQLAAGLAPLDEQHDQAGKSLHDATAAKAGREAELDRIAARLAELQRIDAMARMEAKRAEDEARLGLLTGLRQRIAANDAALKSHSVDAAAIEELEAAERDEARICEAMEAGAARLAIEAKPGTNVTLNGMAITGNAARAVTEPLTIAVGPDVAITISPPPVALDAASSKLSKARAVLSAMLSRHGASTAAELRQRRSERVELENTERELRAERAALGVKDWAEIGQLESALAKTAAEAPRADLPSPDDIANERQTLAERASLLRAECSSFEAQANVHRESLTRLAGTRGDIAGQIRSIHSQLETALAQLPDETREATLAHAAEELEKRRQAHQRKAAALEGERARAPSPDETERRRSRVERLHVARGLQAKKADDLRQAIAKLEGEIEIAGGHGLGERAATLKLQQEMAAADVSRLSHRVEVLKHLRDTVDGCYARRRAELNAPLLRHLKPFLNDVFPEAELSLGENFAVSGLARSGPAAELFGTLSLGTQEQVAVLVRLAMGAMISEKGEDVPVILDDALVFSDDGRIERMFDAISRAGKNQQVIVLTCRSRSFATLGGRELRIV